MDFNDPKQRRIFFEIHERLPRQGPGNRACTEKALRLAGPLPAAPKVLDIGCGPGMQTMDLAGLLPDAEIWAVDFHEAFVAEVKERASDNGIDHRIHASVGDMNALHFEADSFDLIWCEGAAYIMGVENALKAWKKLLKAAGKLALTEAVWLKMGAPVRVRQCWEEYPGMMDVPACREFVRECGFDLLGDFVLPPEAWWDDYYTPMTARVSEMEEKYAGDESAVAVVRESLEEIEVYRDYSDYYGYVFLVMSKA